MADPRSGEAGRPILTTAAPPAWGAAHRGDTMTRDRWMRECAQRLIDRGGLDDAAAAANAAECARHQQEMNGRSPARWDKPADAADEEMSYWTDDA